MAGLADLLNSSGAAPNRSQIIRDAYAQYGAKAPAVLFAQGFTPEELRYQQVVLLQQRDKEFYGGYIPFGGASDTKYYADKADRALKATQRLLAYNQAGTAERDALQKLQQEADALSSQYKLLGNEAQAYALANKGMGQDAYVQDRYAQQRQINEQMAALADQYNAQSLAFSASPYGQRADKGDLKYETGNLGKMSPDTYMRWGGNTMSVMPYGAGPGTRLSDPATGRVAPDATQLAYITGTPAGAVRGAGAAAGSLAGGAPAMAGGTQYMQFNNGRWGYAAGGPVASSFDIAMLTPEQARAYYMGNPQYANIGPLTYKAQDSGYGMVGGWVDGSGVGNFVGAPNLLAGDGYGGNPYYLNDTGYGDGVWDFSGYDTTGQTFTRQISPEFDRSGEGGEYGYYLGDYDAQGNLVDVRWHKADRHDGWFAENLGILGPLAVLAGSFIFPGMFGTIGANGLSGGMLSGGSFGQGVSQAFPGTFGEGTGADVVGGSESGTLLGIGKDAATAAGVVKPLVDGGGKVIDFIKGVLGGGSGTGAGGSSGLASGLGLAGLALALANSSKRSPETVDVDYAQPTVGAPRLPTNYTTGWQAPSYTTGQQ